MSGEQQKLNDRHRTIGLLTRTQKEWTDEFSVFERNQHRMTNNRIRMYIEFGKQERLTNGSIRAIVNYHWKAKYNLWLRIAFAFRDVKGNWGSRLTFEGILKRRGYAPVSATSAITDLHTWIIPTISNQRNRSINPRASGQRRCW